MQRLLHLQSHLIAQSSFEQYRKSSSIDKTQFNKTVYGPNYEQRFRAFEVIEKNPKEFQHYHLIEASRAQQRQLTFKRLLAFTNNVDLAKYSRENPNFLTLYGNGFTFHDLNSTTLLGVHYSLYIKMVERLGTKRHQEFYQNACSFKDIGCMALTELMHGSNVRGILTEAHYDHSSKEFVIHSPSRDAMKFWIGGAAKTANVSVVWAQLYIEGKCYGVHAFVVPIRCRKTHKVLPGVTIGDCGPKFGLNGVDNGFILFEKYRIPAHNLLDKVSGVDKEGKFFSTVKGEGKRFGMTLAALSQGRLFMCCHSTSLGISAVAIALRYTFVRRQFGKDNQPETLLIDYPLTQRRMVPLLAQEVILMCTTMKTFQEAESNPQKNALNPENPLIQQIHAFSSVLKSKTAWAATEAIRQSRQMMGGHGYSAYSKMAALYSNNDVNNTWQGENHVLLQQTTKYVMDSYQKVMKGKEVKSPLLKFLAQPPEVEFSVEKDFLLSLDKIRDYLQSNIAKKVQQLGGSLMAMQGEGKLDQVEVWNNAQVYQGQQVALLTGDLFILVSCLQRLAEISHPQTRQTFKILLHLWSLNVLRQDEQVTESQHGPIEEQIMELCEKVKGQVLGVVEAVAANQNILGSPFANQDGHGFKKYMDLVLEKPRIERADYWRLIADRK